LEERLNYSGVLNVRNKENRLFMFENIREIEDKLPAS
jgi:hypothetical protein